MKEFSQGALVECRPLPAHLVVPFETMGLVRGALPLWSRHLVRLEAAARELGLVQGPLQVPGGLLHAVLETALGNLWFHVAGAWVTPALDQRVLPGIARAVLLEALAARGIEVVERACDIADLHRATAIAVSNAVHGPRRAVLARVRSRGEEASSPCEPGTGILTECWEQAVLRRC